MKEVVSSNEKVSPIATPKGQLTAKELSVHLGMSWTSIQKYFFHLDDFPKKKIGNKWYFHRGLLDEFLKTYHEDNHG